MTRRTAQRGQRDLVAYRDEMLRVAREAEQDGAIESARDLRARAAVVTRHIERTETRRRVRRERMGNMATKLTGHDAIRYAREHGLTMGKYADPTEGAREGLTVEEAERVAAEDPGLVWVALDAEQPIDSEAREVQARAIYEAADDEGVIQAVDARRLFGDSDPTRHTTMLMWHAADLLGCRDELDALIEAGGPQSDE